MQEHVFSSSDPSWLIEQADSLSPPEPFKLILVTGHPEEVNFQCRSFVEGMELVRRTKTGLNTDFLDEELVFKGRDDCGDLRLVVRNHKVDIVS